MVNTVEKVKVLKSIVEDYCGFEIRKISNKIIIDGREKCRSNKHYFIYNNLDEALIEWEEICIAATKRIKENSIFENELEFIEKVKNNYYNKSKLYNNKISYFLKKSILECICAIEKENFDFEFKGISIIVTHNSKKFIFKDIDDVLLRYHNLVQEYVPEKYYLICDMIINKSIEILEKELNINIFQKIIALPYKILLSFTSNGKIEVDKPILECCDELISLLNLKLNRYLYDDKYAYSIFTKKEYLTVCKDIVGKRDTIECIGMDILHSHEDKYLLGNQIIELMENESEFNTLEWKSKFKTLKNLNQEKDTLEFLGDKVLNEYEMFYMLINFLIERDRNKNIESKYYLNKFYEFAKETIEDIISQYYFYNNSSKDYDIRVNIDSITHVLYSIGVPEHIITINSEDEYEEKEIYLNLNSNNSYEDIVIKGNNIYYHDEFYKFKDIDTFISFIKEVLVSNNILIEDKCDYCDSNIILKNVYEPQSCTNCQNKILPQGIEDRIRITKILDVYDISFKDGYYYFKLLFQSADKELEKNINSYSNTTNNESFINCKIEYVDNRFNFDNITIELVLLNKNYIYDFSNEQIEAIKKAITNCIVEKKLYDTSINREHNTEEKDNSSIDNKKSNDIDNKNNSVINRSFKRAGRKRKISESQILNDSINRKIDINEAYNIELIKDYFKISLDENKDSFYVKKEDLIKSVINHIDNATLLNEIDKRLKNK